MLGCVRMLAALSDSRKARMFSSHALSFRRSDSQPASPLGIHLGFLIDLLDLHSGDAVAFHFFDGVPTAFVFE